MTSTNSDILSGLPAQSREAVLKALRERALQNQAPTIRPRGAEQGELPLSPAQKAMWLIETMQSDYSAYNELAAFRVTSEIDIAAFEASLSDLADRHEMLRTVFAIVDGEPVQRVLKEARPLLREIAVVGEDAESREIDVQRHIAEQRAQKFDLQHGPLYSVTLLRRPEAGETTLLLAAHHIIFDGWSINLFLRELDALYIARRRQAVAQLPALEIQYADYALWQHQDVRRKVHHSQLTYWCDRLADLPPVLELPNAKPRPAKRSGRGGRVPVALDTSLTAQVSQFAAREGMTTFAVLLSAFQILLHRCSGRQDIPVGCAVANRTVAEVEPLIGNFLNSVVLRGDLSGTPTAHAYLMRNRAAIDEAFEHKDVPFSAVVEAIKPERSQAWEPLFQIAFNFQNTPKNALQEDGLRLEPVRLNEVTAKYDLILWLEESAGSIQGYWEYSADLFDAPTLDSMSAQLRCVLAGMLADPLTPVDRLPMLGVEERRRVLLEWSGASAEHAAQKSQTDIPLHVQIVSRCKEAGAATSVVLGAERLTYAELDRQSRRIAAQLMRAGQGTGSRVAVIAGRSLHTFVALLGVLRAGAAYVPIDPSYPEERIRFVLSDAGCEIALVTRDAKARFSIENALCIEECLDNEPDEESSESVRCAAVDGGDAAYVIYTSGSTGQPKGVVVTHDNLAHSTAARLHTYADKPSCFLLLSSIAFDSSVAGIYWTLSQGGTVVVPQEDQLLDVAQLRRLVREHGVTHLLAIPGLYHELLHDDAPALLGTLRVAIVAGEPCSSSLVARHFEALPETALYNEYGPTEATVWATVHRCSPSDAQGIVPVGRPIPFSQVYVLDEHSQPVAVGVPGQLHIGGKGVAAGYLNADDLTRQRFRELVIDDASLGRVYCTGDRARWRPDGVLELLGRTDSQVKIRGYRIELGEVEAALAAHPGVEEVAVVMIADRGEARMAAHARTVSDFALKYGKDALALWAAERLVPAAVPTSIWLHTELPRLPNGKIDRSRLGTLSDARQELPDRSLAVSVGARKVVEVWQQILGREGIGPDDDFFKIGGNSLAMIRVFNRLKEFSTVDVPIVELFRQPTPSAIAALLFAPEDEAPESNVSEIERKILDVWERVLGRTDVGLDEDFFKAGGDSLKMVRVYNQLRDVMEVDQPIVELFRNPTPRGLARMLAAERVTGEI